MVHPTKFCLERICGWNSPRRCAFTGIEPALLWFWFAIFRDSLLNGEMAGVLRASYRDRKGI